jgi:hypothetical protein
VNCGPAHSRFETAVVEQFDFLKVARWIQADWCGSPDDGAPAPVFTRRFGVDEAVSIAGLATGRTRLRRHPLQTPPGGSLTRASAYLQTRHGPASIEWRKTADRLEIDLCIPDGASGILDLPGQEPESLPAGKHRR